MTHFSKYIADRWNIASGLAKELCDAFTKGDTPYYLAEYYPACANELELPQIWEIFDFLSEMEELEPKKKRLITQLTKATVLDDEVKARVDACTSTAQLNDLSGLARPNVNSKGQIALKQGLGPLADILQKQEEETRLPEELAEPFVGTPTGPKSVEDALAGACFILAERFAYDESVRSMVRDFCYDSGFFEILPKNRKDKAFAQYIGKFIPLPEIQHEELLSLIQAERSKTVKIKIGIQLFRITELLKHHFIVNPSATSYDLICQSIDDSWSRLLHEMAEEEIKSRILREAEDKLLVKLAHEIDTVLSGQSVPGTQLAIGEGSGQSLAIAVVGADGRLMGATQVEKALTKPGTPCDRLRQFVTRYRPVKIVIAEGATGDSVEQCITATFGTDLPVCPIARQLQGESTLALAQSPWMLQACADLDDTLKQTYAMGLLHATPLSLVGEIGAAFFTIHPQQHLVEASRFKNMIDRMITRKKILAGIVIKDNADILSRLLPSLSKEVLSEIKIRDSKNLLNAKNDLLSITGLTEIQFRNIAGFILIPDGNDILDRTIIHPDLFDLVQHISETINTPVDQLISNPEGLNSFFINDPVIEMYTRKKLIDHLRSGQRYLSTASRGNSIQNSGRRLRLNELVEGNVTSGIVTNIKPFGVFIDINAVCDGLIHISQLADAYVEAPEQVVNIGTRVEVRIIKVDTKKRRISLTMKNMGQKALHVAPSQRQLSSLATHFQNR